MFRAPFAGRVAALAFVLLGTTDVGRGQCHTTISAPDGDLDNGFGHRAAMDGSLTAIGAPHDDVNGQYSGSVYVLDALTGQSFFKLTASNGFPDELFGYTLALDGGLLAVGSPGIFVNAFGPVRVFDLSTGLEISQLHPSLQARHHGDALALDAGMVAVGDHEQMTAYLYDALTGAELHAFQDTSLQDGTYFGYSLAIAANMVAVGAPTRTAEVGTLGVVVVYDATTGLEAYTLFREANASFFGWTLATTGSRLVVGSNQTLNVFDITTGAHLNEFFVPAPSIIAADGDRAIVSDGWSNSTYVVNLVTGEVEEELVGVHPTSSLAMGANRWMVCHGGGGAFEKAYLWNGDDADEDGFYDDCQDVGTSYCGPANPNSTGASAWIAGGGSAVVADGDLRIRALALPQNQSGYFLVSGTQGFVPFAGGSQGNLCLAGQIGRFSSQVKSSGANGRITIFVDLTALPPGMHAVQPGEVWNFQGWYRDVNPTQTSNFTDGVQILFE